MAVLHSQSIGPRSRVKASPSVVNLRERFGRQYKVEYDPAYFWEYGENARVDDPWLQVVPGRLGHIYPYGGDLLAVSTNFHGRLANRLIAMPSCNLVQDGDDGVTLVFHVRHFREIAKLIRARGRRVLTAAARRKLVAAGAASRFHNAAAMADARNPREACDDPAPCAGA